MPTNINRVLAQGAWVLALIALGTTGAFAQSALDVRILGKGGSEIGTLALRPIGTGVLARIEVKPGALTPGWHGVHFHAAGDCSDLAEFKSAKGHINVAGHTHGLANDKGPEEGDLPNLYAGADGSAHGEMTSFSVTLGEGQASLRGPNGAALIIHASEDDHTSQPIGNAGARVGCAVIK